MKANWKLFGAVCAIQMIAAVFLAFHSLSRLAVRINTATILNTFCYLLVAALPIFALSVLTRNHPDRPVAGRQKAVFNWLFLLNFINLAFLFGMFFSQLNTVVGYAKIFGGSVLQLPFRLTSTFYTILVVLILHLVILYGMFELRRFLFINYIREKQFEFERK